MNSNFADRSLFFSRTYEFLEVFLVKQCNKSVKTRESYRDSLTVFKRFVEHSGYTIKTFLYSDCTYEFLLTFKEYLSNDKGYKASSINQRLAALKSYMKYSAGCDSTLTQIWMSISNVPESTVPKEVRPTLNKAAVAALLDKPPATKKGLRDTVIMSLLFDAAIRLDELVQLTTADIYRSDDYTYLLIHGKGNKERKVSISNNFVKLLDAYLNLYHSSETPYENSPLIYTVINGERKPMSHRNIQLMLKKYGELVQQDGYNIDECLHPHLLRRTRATDLYQNGTPIEIVSRFLGHSSIETTKNHYAFASEEQMRKAINSGMEGDVPQLWKGHEDELTRMCGLR